MSIITSCTNKKDDPQPVPQQRIEDTSSIIKQVVDTSIIKQINGKLWIPIESNGKVLNPIDSLYSDSIIKKYHLFVFDFTDLLKRVNSINKLTIITREMVNYAKIININYISPSEQYYSIINQNPLLLAVDPNNTKYRSVTISTIDSTTISLDCYFSDGSLVKYKCTSKQILRFGN